MPRDARRPPIPGPAGDSNHPSRTPGNSPNGSSSREELEVELAAVEREIAEQLGRDDNSVDLDLYARERELRRLVEAASRTGKNGNEARSSAADYIARSFDQIEEESLDWLWYGMLPRHVVTVLDGNSDVGKSTLLLDIVARVTSGKPMPGETEVRMGPSPVVVMVSEDAPGRVVKPRLKAAGADLSKVHHFSALPVRDDEGNKIGERLPRIPDDIDALESFITKTGAVFVVVDMLLDFLSPHYKAKDDQEVTRALLPLLAMAERTGACVVLLRHVPKGQQGAGQALMAGTGAVSITGKSRSVLIAAQDPTDPTGTRRVLACGKNNLTALRGSFAFELQCSTCHRTGCTEEAHNFPRVHWIGKADLSADQILASRESDEERSQQDLATDWLREYLLSCPEQTKASADILRDARLDGHSQRTIQRAREQLGVTIRHEGFPRHTFWTLPPQSCQAPSDPDGTTGLGTTGPRDCDQG